MGRTVYSYNGIELPELPDTGSYSYRYIIQYSGTTQGSGHLLLATNTAAFYVSGDGVAWSEELVTIGFTCSEGGTEWSGGDVVDMSSVKGTDGYYYLTALGAVIWTDTDIYYDSGGIYMEGTEPVLLVSKWDNMRAFVRGLLAGLVSEGRLPDAAKEPVANLYNGVRLPLLERALSTPYLTIVCDPDSEKEYPYRIYEHSLPITIVVSDTNPNYYNMVMAEETDYTYKYIPYPEESSTFWWKNSFELGLASEIPWSLVNVKAELIWANYDVYFENGLLALEATEPIPVYE